MSSLQQQARAMGDPTRHRIYQFIAAADHDVDIAELSDLLGINHNAVRQHLAKLVEAGLVVEGKAPKGRRGRPRLTYQLDPGAQGPWALTSVHERISWLLAEVVQTGDRPEDVGRRAGARARPERIAVGDPLDGVVDEVARQGFAPTLDRDGDDFEITLHRCPFESTALIAPDTVCALHLGLTRGLTDGAEGIEITELVREDPRHGRCRLRGHTEPA